MSPGCATKFSAKGKYGSHRSANSACRNTRRQPRHADAHAKAAQRFARAEEIAYEACAHQLCRFYNAFEQAGLRLAKAFENHIDDDEGWHTVLLNRLCLEIEGVRPALIPREIKNSLNELRGFRHVMVHAYDLELDPAKLRPLLKYAEDVAGRFPQLVEAFVSSIEKQLPAQAS